MQLLQLFKPGLLSVGYKSTVEVFKPNDHIVEEMLDMLENGMSIAPHGKILTSFLSFNEGNYVKNAEFAMTTYSDGIFFYLGRGLPVWVALRIVSAVVTACRQNGVKCVRTQLMQRFSEQDMLYVSMGFKPDTHGLDFLNGQLAAYCLVHGLEFVPISSINEAYSFTAGLEAPPFWDWASEKDGSGLLVEYRLE